MGNGKKKIEKHGQEAKAVHLFLTVQYNYFAVQLIMELK